MKTNLTKRILATLLAGTMVASFVSCGDKEDTKLNADNTSSKVDAQTSSEADKDNTDNTDTANMDGDVQLNEPGKFPIVIGEPVTFTAWVSPHMDTCTDFDVSENKATQYIEDKLNVHFDWEVVSKADKITKLNLLFSGENYPDIIFNSEWDGTVQYTYGQEGYIIPLNDYLEGDDAYYYNEYIAAGKEAKDGSVSDSILKQNVMPDGNTYSLYSYVSGYHGKWAYRMWMYEPWVKAVGMEMPTTTEEYYNVLKAFKEKDPNGNGKADELPLTGSPKGWNTNPIDFIMNSFLYFGGESQNYSHVEDGKIVFEPVQEAFKEGLKYLSKLNEDGLIITETWTQDGTALKGLTTQETALVGCTPAGGLGAIAAVASQQEGDWTNWKSVAPLKGPEGIQYSKYVTPNPLSMFQITDNCKYPKTAFRVGDALYESDNYFSTRYGVKGESWDYAPEGTTGLDGKPAKYVDKQSEVNAETKNHAWGLISNACMLPGWGTSQVVEGNNALNPEVILYEAAYAYSKFTPDEAMIMPNFVFPEEDVSTVVDLKTTLHNYLETEMVNLILSGDVDANWDKFVKGLEQLQYKELVEIYQKAYDAMQ